MAALEKPGMTLEEVLRESRERLRAAGIEDPALESRILVEHFTDTTRAHAITAPRRPVDQETVEAIRAAVARRAEGESVYRVIGAREFYGLELGLSRATLEPRPDTEALVDEMLPFVRDVARRAGTCRILDLGTGSGAIALALISQVEGAQATGVDILQEALDTASANAAALGLADRFTAVHANWFKGLSGRYDAIVSNPPYIPTGLIPNLDREVRDFDPVIALDGGEDGLEAYRIIAAHGREHLEEGGRIGVEIGFDQRLDVAAVFAKSGFVLISERQDLGGNDRVLVFGRG